MSQMTMTLWTATNGDHPSCLVVQAAVQFSPEGILPIEQNPPLSAGKELIVTPVRRKGDVLGIVLVPIELKEDVRRNRIPLDCGAHVLRHADCLEMGSGRLWISATGKAEETSYDPAIHGEDRFCPRTKARLAPNDPIVVCPGTPRDKCEAIYKAAAWKIGTPCHQCGFDPGAPPWEPPTPRQRGSLATLL